MLPPPTSVSSVQAPAQRRAPAERLLDGEEDQAALFGLVDDRKRDAGALLDPVQEHVHVPGLAHRAGRHGVNLGNPIAIDDAPEILEGRERGIDGLRIGSHRTRTCRVRGARRATLPRWSESIGSARFHRPQDGPRWRPCPRPPPAEAMPAVCVRPSQHAVRDEETTHGAERATILANVLLDYVSRHGAENDATRHHVMVACGYFRVTSSRARGLEAPAPVLQSEQDPGGGCRPPGGEGRDGSHRSFRTLQPRRRRVDFGRRGV